MTDSNANGNLDLSYGVVFDVKTGGDKATEKIKEYSDAWQKLLNDQKLVIKMGADAAVYDRSKNYSDSDSAFEKSKRKETETIEKEFNKQQKLRESKFIADAKAIATRQQQYEQMFLAAMAAREKFQNESAKASFNGYSGKADANSLSNLKELSAYYKELSDRARDFYNANQSDKSAALDGMKKRLEQIKKEMADIEYNLIGITEKKKPRAETTIQLNWIEDLKKEAAGIQAAMNALNSIQTGGAPANVQKLNSELTTTNFTLLQMREYYKQVAAENAKLVKEATSKANTKDVFGMKEGSIEEIQRKVERLNNSMRLFSDTAGKVGMNDEKLNGAWHRANDEVNRLQQKLAAMQGSFGNRSLNSLLQINPKSIQETNALMAELARRRDALNRNDPGYANSLSTINKRQAELSAENARALGISQQKEKSINAETEAFGKQSTVISNLRNMAATYLSLYEGARLIGQIAKITGEFELQEKSLAAIIQSAEKAHELFGQIKALAVVSPFKFSELLSYTKQLAAYRVETDQLYDTTKKLADVSAGLGVDMSRIILAYGQVQAASVLRGQELRQFTEAGIPLVALLADKFSELEGRVVSTGEVFGKISERMVSFQMVKDIFGDMTNEGGMFYNMQEIQADTLAGKISNLTDAYQIMFASIGEGGFVNDVLKGTIDLVTKLARNWESVAAVMVPLTIGLGAYKAGLLIISGVEAAQAGIYAKKIAAQTTMIGLNDKEAASIARKTALQEASLLGSKARITADTIMGLASARNIAFDKAEIVSKSIKTAVIKAGSDATKLANLQTEIANILTAKGIAADRAAAMSRLALSTATNTATASTMTFGATIKAMFASVPVFGWILALIAGLVAIGSAAYNSYKESQKLKKELDSIGTAGSNESAQLAGKFKQLSETARDTTKSLKEQNDALNTLKQVYGDILPDYMLTIEGLVAIGDNYNKVTAAIYANIAAKTKEKQINAVTENYQEDINPILDGLKTDLGDVGVDAVLAGKAINELQKRINEGTTTAKTPFLELVKILEEINGTEIKWGGAFQARNFAQLKGGANELLEALRDQKKMIEEISNTDYSFFNKFDGQAKKLDDEIKKATDQVIQGQKQVAGKTVYFDESIYQFNERKANTQRDLLIDFINKTKDAAAKALQNGDEKLSIGMNNWLEGAMKRLANLDANPLAANINRLIERTAKAQGINPSQFNSLEFTGDNGDEFFKDLESKYTAIKEKIERVNKANKDFKSGVKANVLDKGVVEISKEELLSGYKDAQGVKQKGFKQELEQIEVMRAAYGLVDKEKKGSGGSTVNPRIAAIENEIALVEQAKKKYEELVKAGKSPEQSKAVVEDLYKGQFNLKNEKREILFKPVFDEKGLISSLNTAKTELKKIPKTEQPVFKVNLKINESEIKIFTDEMKAVLDSVEKEFNTSKKRIDIFKNIFDATGDTSLSKQIAESIEGAGTTDIETALNKAFKASFEAVNVKPMFDKMGNVDIAASQAEINKLDTKSDVRTQAQKQLDIVKEFKAKEITELLKGLKDYETFESRKTAISRAANEERFIIQNDTTLNPAQKEKYIASSVKKENEAKAKINVEQFKDSPLWAETFGNLDKVSPASMELLKVKLKELIESVKDTAEPTQIKELIKNFEELEDRTNNIDFSTLFQQMFENIDLTPLKKAVNDSISEVKRLKTINDEDIKNEGVAKGNSSTILKKNGGDVTNSEYVEAKNIEDAATKKVTESTIALTNATNNQVKAEDDFTTASNKKTKAIDSAIKKNDSNIEGFTKIKAVVDDSISAFYSVADAIGLAIPPETKEILDGLSKGIGAIIAVLGVVAAVLEVVAFAATQAGIAFFAAMAPLWPLIAAAAALVAVFAILKAIKLNGINDELKKQEAIVASLEKQYAELERQMENSLGTDWLEAYNQELINTQAQIVSISKQIELEKSKGKDAKPEDIKKFKEDLEAKQIIAQEASEKLQQFISGTNLNSTASDFASAWLDAYKSFGSTTDAMKAKFKDMINNMVVNTLLAKAMEIALKPIFTAMEDAASLDKGDKKAGYSPEELAGIVAETTKATSNADANLNALMDGLKAAGIDVRDSSTNLTGLSKGISGITEDTGLLLGGYLDSIRFRMFQHLDLIEGQQKYDFGGSIDKLLALQGTQINHLLAISANTLSSAKSNADLLDKINSVMAVSTTGTGYALRVNA